MSKGGGKKITTGYWYHLTVLLGVCHGPVDSVNKIAIGNRLAWSGAVTSSSTIHIDKLDLFGGEKREGGVQGNVAIMMGEETQTPSGLLATTRGNDTVAYRGLLSLCFEDFRWSANNPYFKPPAVEVTRILKGWRDDTVWYPAKAVIGSLDMNPAHIIYECLTNRDWGMGYDPIDLDESTSGSSFKTAADTLFAEEFGLSIPWMQQSSVEDFIRVIIDHIGAALQFDIRIGKFTLKLVRGGYDINDPAQAFPINPDNATLLSFQRAAWGETANEIVVVYTDRNGQNVSLAVQDPANIEVQGAVVSVTKQYPGIKTHAVAERVALRDLQAGSSPLAKISLEVNRSGATLKAGDILNVSWPPSGITQAAYRVIGVNRGTLTDGKIKIEAIEDVFGLPTQGYMDDLPTGGWTPTYADPVPLTAAYQRAQEATYYDLATTLRTADLNVLEVGDGFGTVYASYPDLTAYSFSVVENVSGAWEEKQGGDFCTTATLTSAVPVGATEITATFTSARVHVDLASCVGQHAFLGDEIVLITGFPSATTVSFKRGCLDTVPAYHAANSILWMGVRDSVGFDADVHVETETITYKALALTRSGTPDPSVTSGPGYCIPLSVNFDSRKDRPYVPGQFKINGSYYPAGATGDVVLTWAGRNRLVQTAGVVDTDVAHITPEAGTTYTINVYDPDSGTPTVPIRTVTGITAHTWTYTSGMETSDGGPFDNIRFTLTAVRDGFNSLQTHDWTVARTLGLGESLGEYLGEGV